MNLKDLQGITKEDVTEIIQFIQEINEFKPIVDALTKVAKDLLMDTSGEFKPVLDALLDYRTQKDIDAYNSYKNAGMNGSDAIKLILANKNAMKNSLDSMNANKARKE